MEIDEKRVYEVCVLDKRKVVAKTALTGKMLKRALLEILRIKVMGND